MPDRPARRLLLVAWAGADWRIAQPLIDAGELPNLSTLASRGARGNLATLNPHTAPVQWTSLLTGKRADKHGLLGYWYPDAQGSRPVGSRDRRCKALWNILSDAALRVHSVGWPFSYPAEAINGCMVSDIYALAGGTPEAPAPIAPAAISPVAAIHDLEPLRIHPGELGLDDMAFFLARPEAIDQNQDPRLGLVAASIARIGSVHAAATALMEAHDWDALLVHYDALDVLGPAFMVLQPPRLDYVPLDLFEQYRGVIQAIYRMLDLQLGRLVELAGPDTAIMLVSQRGYRTGEMRPRDIETASQRLAAPWYRDQGMIALAGPGVRQGVRIEGASLLDVVPTALALLNLPLGRDLDGRPLRAALAGAITPASIGSWEPPATGAPAPPELSPAMIQVLLDSWRVHPDAPRAGQDAPPGVEAARADWDFNLAMVYLESNRPELAEPILGRLSAAAPADARLKIHLARCREALGDPDGAIGLYAEVVGEIPGRPREQMALAALNVAREDNQKALMNLFRAEQAEPNDPGIHCRIGEVYLRMKRWPDALRAFQRSLALDPDSALAHHGLAIVHLGERRYAEAMDAALTSVGLRHHSPQAHYHLGLALAHLDQPAAAIAAFETCTQQDARNGAAHRWLARLHQEDAPDKAKLHLRRASELDAARILRARTRSA